MYVFRGPTGKLPTADQRVQLCYLMPEWAALERNPYLLDPHRRDGRDRAWQVFLQAVRASGVDVSEKTLRGWTKDLLHFQVPHPIPPDDRAWMEALEAIQREYQTVQDELEGKKEVANTRKRLADERDARVMEVALGKSDESQAQDSLSSISASASTASPSPKRHRARKSHDMTAELVKALVKKWERSAEADKPEVRCREEGCACDLKRGELAVDGLKLTDLCVVPECRHPVYQHAP